MFDGSDLGKTQAPCTTSAVLATFLGSQVFHRGVTMTDTNSSPTVSRGPGFGTWVKSGSSYTIKFRFHAYDRNGVVSGAQRITRTVTLAASKVAGARSTMFHAVRS